MLVYKGTKPGQKQIQNSVCEVGTVGKISDYQPEGSGVEGICPPSGRDPWGFGPPRGKIPRDLAPLPKF